MKIAVLSGKGGTGKTTVAASLAKTVKPCMYLDCDVEEPNGYIFLKPDFTESVPVYVSTPVVNTELCNGCGDCARACRFNAIAVVRGNVIIFPELCHHCGACLIVCKTGALNEAERQIGIVNIDATRNILQGKLDIGEMITIPVIQKIKRYMRSDIPAVLDCSPGASCTVVQTIEGCDYCLLVTEPTPFGLHDLRIAVSLVRKMGLPFGVVLNKATDEADLTKKYCEREGIEILLEIPYSRTIAEAYSKGILPVDGNDLRRREFESMYGKIRERAGG